MKPSTVPLLLLCLLLTQCSWLFPKKEAQPELPPATQEGRNTFGCYLNGKPWTPKGRAGTMSNLNTTYDPFFSAGTFSIKAFRRTDDDHQTIIINSDSLSSTGTFSLSLSGRHLASFYNRQTGCDYDDPAQTYISGTLTITRFDLQAKVIAGTFEFTLARPGCDTVRVTDGRFDSRLY